MSLDRMRQTWAEGRTTFGAWVSGGGEFSWRAYHGLPFDYIATDCQHGVADVARAEAMLLGSSTATQAHLVRPAANDPAILGRLVDCGADGVIVPMINTAAEAERVVASVTYPPTGARSYGPIRADLRSLDLDALADRVGVFVMAETAVAIRNIAAISGVPGLAGIYLGPVDLSIDLGLDHRTGYLTDQFADVVARVADACRDAGIVLAFHCRSGEEAGMWIDRGARMITIGSDSQLLARAAEQELSTARGGEA